MFYSIVYLCNKNNLINMFEMKRWEQNIYNYFEIIIMINAIKKKIKVNLYEIFNYLFRALVFILLFIAARTISMIRK